MKILAPGSIAPKFVGRVLECIECRAKFQLEAGDAVRLVPDQRDGDYYEVACPTCGRKCTASVRR